jgi:hypothetical protein
MYVQIRSDKLRELLSKHGGFGTILAFKPTGWTFNGDASRPPPDPLTRVLASTSAILNSTATVNAAANKVPPMASLESHQPVLLQHGSNAHGGGDPIAAGGSACRATMHTCADDAIKFEAARATHAACNAHMEVPSQEEQEDDAELDGMVAFF